MKTIEFIGTSGSGKSTAMKILVKYLKSQKISYRMGEEAIKLPKYKKKFYIISFILKNLTLSCYILRKTLTNKDKFFIIKRFFRSFYCLEYSRHKGLTIFDEALMLKGLYLSDTPKNYIKKIPKPQYLIYVKTNLEIAEKRMMKRGEIHSIQGLNKKEIKNLYKNSSNYFESLSLELEKTGVKIIRINNDKTPSDMEKDLLKILKELNFSF